MSLSAMLDKTGTHSRQVNAKDAIGGNTVTFTTQTASVPLALWLKSSYLARTFARQDLVGDHVIVTDSDLGAKSGDRFTITGESGYFLVHGAGKFSNAAVSSEAVYLIDASRRIV